MGPSTPKICYCTTLESEKRFKFAAKLENYANETN